MNASSTRQHGLMSVRPATFDDWARTEAADGHAIASQGPHWRNALASSGWRDASTLYELSDGRCFVLPLWERGHGPVTIAASPPASWGFGGLIGPDVDRRACELVLSDLRSRGYLRVSVRPRVDQSIFWEKAASPDDHIIARHCHLLDLRGGADRVRSGMTKKTRKELAQIEKSDRIDIVHDTTGVFLPVYYSLYERSLERWAERSGEPSVLAKARGRRRDPLSKLQAIASALGPNFHLWLAWVDGQPAAGMIILAGNNAHDTRGAMDRSVTGNLSVNVLLQWKAIEHACDAGMSWYHLGETAKGSSLASYKERFGAVGIDCIELRSERAPLSLVEQRAKSIVKRVVGFRE